MLNSVLEKEAFLFDDRELFALRRFADMNYEAKYLFIRLYLRKRGFIRLNMIEYTNDIEDLEAACESLCARIDLPMDGIEGQAKEDVETPSSLVEEVTIFSSPPLPCLTAPIIRPPLVTSIDLTVRKKVKLDDSDTDVLDLTMSSDDDEDEEDKQRVLITGGHKEDVERGGDAISLAVDLYMDLDRQRDFTRVAEGEEVLVSLDTEAVLNLLYCEELVKLGKSMKVAVKGNSKGDWLDALLNCTGQAMLSFAPVSRKGKEKESKTAAVGLGYDVFGNKLKQSSVVSGRARKIIGPAIRLHPSYVALFDRLSLVYHRTSYTSSTSSTASLTSSLLARFGKRVFPEYVVTRTFSIFESSQSLREYERALELEKMMEECLGETWTKEVVVKTKEERKVEREKGWERGIQIFRSVWDRWNEMCRGGAKELEDEKASKAGEGNRLLYYRARFRPGWPMTRIVYKAAAIYARLHDRAAEIKLLRALLRQYSFRRGKRGEWYDRLALLLMRYPATAEEKEDWTPQERKDLAVARQTDALEICRTGLRDPYCHLIYQSSLQRRIARLESILEVAKEDRQVFDELLLKAETRIMEGTRLDDAITGKKSIWSSNSGEEVSVEELALEQYIKEGWKGFHSENGILTTIFSLCMWDIIFMSVDGVFETEYQSAPLDLSTDAFAIVRRKAIKKRLAEIENGKAALFLEIADDRERTRETWCVGVRWNDYSKKDLLEIVECLGGHAVSVICRMFAEEFNHRTGGIPDLCLWNAEEGEIMFVEVKGPGDTLSETQKVWIDLLLVSGTKVEVLKMMTSAEKDLMEEKKQAAQKKKEKKQTNGAKRKRCKIGDDGGEDGDSGTDVDEDEEL